jgi:signal transduction histidine kinase
MASKLSHELRTPITVVRSSLDNLNEGSNPEDVKIYSDRARQGIERLNSILTRMSEATRLEQTLQSEQRSNFDVKNVIAGCIEGYRVAHPDITFNLSYQSDNTYMISGTPDLIAQLLDKLISNAIDFFKADTPINISLKRDGEIISLIVANSGPILPDEMQANLFESMVSVRDKKGEQPHLGLGLYIVRLITDFHHGQVYAINKADNTGVEFHVELPTVHS